MDHKLLGEEETGKQMSLFSEKGVAINPPSYIPPSQTDDSLTQSQVDGLQLLPSASCQDHPDAELYYSEHVFHTGVLQVGNVIFTYIDFVSGVLHSSSTHVYVSYWCVLCAALCYF
jgi:hypothetical protein